MSQEARCVNFRRHLLVTPMPILSPPPFHKSHQLFAHHMRLPHFNQAHQTLGGVSVRNTTTHIHANRLYTSTIIHFAMLQIIANMAPSYPHHHQFVQLKQSGTHTACGSQSPSSDLEHAYIVHNLFPDPLHS
jgi:hypothetical protein